MLTLGKLYFSGYDDSAETKSYHRVYCSKCGKTVYTGYRSVEYVLREYTDTTTNQTYYYYLHDEYADTTDRNSETACYYCLVNKENFVATKDTDIGYLQAKSYNEALARERYYQKEKITAKLLQNIKISVTRRKLSITNTDIIFILDHSASMTSSDIISVKNACSNILDAMVSEGLSSNFYIGVIGFGSTSEFIGKMENSSELSTLKANINSKYKSNGNTSYSSAFKKTQEIFKQSYFSGRTNDRIIIFMTDGKPNSGDGVSELTELKNTYGVVGFYSINYGTVGVQILQTFKNMFTPRSEVIQANSDNLTEAFKDILYQVNSSTPEPIETVDGRLDISDMEVSAKKPLEITVQKGGTIIKKIKITSYPTSSEGIVIIDGGKMYLSVSGLAEACGLTDFTGVSVDISYYSIS